MKTNRNSATEDDVGKLHALVTKGYTLMTSRMIDEYQKKFQEAQDCGDVEKAQEIYSELQFIMDSRDLNAAAKWVALNDMGSLPAAEDGTTPLGQELAELKERHANNIIEFVRAGNE